MDVVRILRSIVVVLLVVVFLSVLVSAYANYRSALSATKLAEACSTVANHIALNDLAYVVGGETREYVVDPARAGELPSVLELGGENYGFSVELSTPAGIIVNSTAEPPANTQVAAISLPVGVIENFRIVPGLLEVRVWRV